jgi:hypothetical protein
VVVVVGLGLGVGGGVVLSLMKKTNLHFNDKYNFHVIFLSSCTNCMFNIEEENGALRTL